MANGDTKERNDNPNMNDKEQKETRENEIEKQAQASETAGDEIESDLAKLQKQLAESESTIGTYKDQLFRLAAEFENFRKRVEADRNEFIKYSNEKLIKDLLPVLDDFGRALATGGKNSDFESFYKGIELIYQKFARILEEKGLKPIESLGKEFDVMYHDVLMQIPSPGALPHTVLEEVERGYLLHGKVIKHAKVVIASEGEKSGEPEKKE